MKGGLASDSKAEGRLARDCMQLDSGLPAKESGLTKIKGKIGQRLQR